MLNDSQTKAAFHIEGPMLVLAGAGSGKTRIITHRILHLLSIGVSPAEILAVTFTNKAAEEMKHRIFTLSQERILASTFHSLCARILRESISVLGYGKDFLILDEEDSEKYLRQCMATFGIKEDKSFIKDIKKQISQAKAEILTPEDIPSANEPFKSLYGAYQRVLKQYYALDFDDLLFLTVKLFKEFPDVLKVYQLRWRFILIDEYQDTNQAQYLLVKLLSEIHHNVFAVGDPDQSIYSWRGANIQNILHFEQDYEGAVVVFLEQNYRSSNTILEAANALIAQNEGRYKKSLWSQRGAGERISLFIADQERQEADFITNQIELLHKKGTPYREMAIFYRTNFQSRSFEDALIRDQIPYAIVGGLSFYQRREIKDILAYLRMVVSGLDYLAFSRTIVVPKRGIGDVALQKIQKAALENGCDLFITCQKIVEGQIPAQLSERQIQGLDQYIKIIQALREMHQEGKGVKALIEAVVERSQYFKILAEDKETFEERKENVEEMIGKAQEWEEEVESPSLILFLEELALKPSIQDPKEEKDTVRLMTLHNGKGLEFEAAFLVGMEEDLFPHINSKDSPEKIEEERRLCYVGMTRAKDFLFLTASRQRFLWGAPRYMRPSRFLKEVPARFFEKKTSQELAIGDFVVHKLFGKGLLKRIYQTSLGLTFDVQFETDQEVKTLSAKYANLKPLI